MKTVHFALAVAGTVIAATTVFAQDAGEEATRLFEAGRYEQVIEAAGPGAPPDTIFAAVLSQQKLGAASEAVALARRLGELPQENAWHFIGRSVEQLLADDTDAALASADRAVQIDPALAEAHHQRGLVLARREAWRDAAVAFDEAAEADPTYAYAYYYAGLAHSRANRPDLMAVRFERFLKLAPEAPERPEVLQLMRTIRGR